MPDDHKRSTTCVCIARRLLPDKRCRQDASAAPLDIRAPRAVTETESFTNGLEGAEEGLAILERVRGARLGSEVENEPIG